MIPELSVAVPVFNRADILSRTLEALAGQDLDADRYEVIVVDDGSTDSTPETIAHFVDSAPDLFKHVRFERNRGLQAARNAGVEAARSPIVLFLDSDLVSCPRLVRTHVETHAAHPEENRAVLGRVAYPPDDPRAPLRNFGNQVVQMWSHVERMAGQLLDWRFFLGGHISVKRSLLARCGGFDRETFRVPGFGDCELGLRLHREFGLRIVYAPQAVAYHYHWRQPTAVLENARAYGGNLARWLEGKDDIQQQVLTGMQSYGYLQDHPPFRVWLREKARRALINSLTVPVMLAAAGWLERRWEWAAAALYWKTQRHFIREGFLEAREAAKG